MGLSMGTHFLLRPNSDTNCNCNCNSDTNCNSYTNSDTNFVLECSV
ncbi:hypothetical protein V1292_002685 [Bradyrhizobium sp. AZCC 1719]